ncbi:hypothetical protein V6N13_035406 [Hibiscus sabdariffa]
MDHGISCHCLVLGCKGCQCFHGFFTLQDVSYRQFGSRYAYEHQIKGVFALIILNTGRNIRPAGSKQPDISFDGFVGACDVVFDRCPQPFPWHQGVPSHRHRYPSHGALIVHDDGNPDGGVRFNQSKSETTNIIRAFKKVNDEEVVTVQTMSVISPYATMHVDICSLADDKCANLILLPFHKEVKADGHMGNPNSNFANVNNNVLMNMPCSVAILVDRGISSKVFESTDKFCGHFTRQIAMLFIGGPILTLGIGTKPDIQRCDL